MLRSFVVLLGFWHYCTAGTIVDEYHRRTLNTRSTKPTKGNPAEKSTEYWMNSAQAVLAEKLEQTTNLKNNYAKNIILFMGDGMSVHTITATRAFLGDCSKKVYFEQFPYVGLSKTYSVDKRVPDSASTATAYLSGVKANYETIGVSAEVPRGDCHKANDTSTHTESLAKWAQDAGMWAGLVTTARVTHASPAGVYAHTANRDWENDAEIVKSDCSPIENVDIARQLIEWPVGRELRVIMGGGRRNFIGTETRDEEYKHGRRLDKRDLIREWLEDKEEQGAEASYVWNKKQLNEVDLKGTDYLLGLFSSSHCPFHGDLVRNDLVDTIPSLSEMTKAAIELLSKNDKGYFLFVEGAKIDFGHHETRAHRSLEDTAEFARAVELARNMTSEKDTLIVVTSDHSHTMTIGGYPTRGSDIFGLAPNEAADHLPYTILSYANGPGYMRSFATESGRRDLSDADLNDPKYRFMASVPLNSETHGGEDVGVFASGPREHYFSGNYEQSNIPALMAYAANIGPFSQFELMKKQGSMMLSSPKQKSLYQWWAQIQL